VHHENIDNESKYIKIKHVCNGYEDVAIQTMKEAANVEAELAIQEGDIDVDGMPITVVSEEAGAKDLIEPCIIHSMEWQVVAITVF